MHLEDGLGFHALPCQNRLRPLCGQDVEAHLFEDLAHFTNRMPILLGHSNQDRTLSREKLLRSLLSLEKGHTR